MSGILLCVDWDETCTNAHWHNYLMMHKVMKGNGTTLLDELMHNDNAIKNFYNTKGIKFDSSSTLAGLKNQSTLIEFIKNQLEMGNNVAITSYTSFPEIIKPALLQAGLSEEQLAKIFIRPGFPPEASSEWSKVGKKHHIKDVMEHFHVTSPANVIVIDDSENNTNAARMAGHHAITVPRVPNPPDTYLEVAKMIVENLTGDMQQLIQPNLTIAEAIEAEAPVKKESSPPPSPFVPLKKAKFSEGNERSAQSPSSKEKDKKEGDKLIRASSPSRSSPKQQ